MTDKYDQLGFVSVEEIQNVFTTMKTELVQKILPFCPTIEARSDIGIVVEFFDAIRATLMMRARDNVQDYIRKNPAVKQAEREKQADDSATHTRQTFEDRIRRGRAVALGQG